MKKLLALALALSVYGCQEAESNKVNNSELCVVNDVDIIPNCKEGNLIAFLPNSWGNEQLPLYFAAIHCDFNHQIIYNNGGVVCVYTAKRNQKLLKQEKK
ncbi:MAG: hypothetical protein ACPLXN_06065 [Sulfurihydrogenibium sp.]|uniref:hypothetical protein n=1 Tax=Sulfurihydrogenibium sp. TaxID=2053621 RepID=UPI000CBF8A26|nr:MAG: hypothetical protein C0198_05225 [Sulfurihydrogenibium sp.]